jgi:hypothetical protein
LHQNSNQIKSHHQQQLHRNDHLQQRHENRQHVDAQFRNGQLEFPQQQSTAVRSVRSVVHVPSFSVLDSESIHAPSPQRPRFRDIDTSAVLPEPVSSFVEEPLPDIRTQAARLKRMLAADAMRQERPIDVRRSDLTPAADALRYDELRNDDIARRSSTKYHAANDDNDDAEFDEDAYADSEWRAESSVAFVVADSAAAVLPYAPSPRFVKTATPMADSRLSRMPERPEM